MSKATNTLSNITHIDAYRTKPKATAPNHCNHPHQCTITSKEQLIDLLESVQIEAIIFNRAFKKMTEQTGASLHMVNHYEYLEIKMTTALNAVKGGL